jgi:SAM-dependent methyltransferase
MMGSATIQGQLWGTNARAWAELAEHISLPLFGAALDAARVTSGTRVLDAGSGSGMTAVLAAMRGAEVSAVDASAAMLAVARERLPNADIRQADLEELPYDGGTFDAVVAINSVNYAENPAAAMNELARVVRSGGRVVIGSWGPPEKCDHAILMRGLATLMPPPPPGAMPGGPFALAAPGVIEALLEGAELTVAEREEVPASITFPNSDIFRRAILSAGPAQAMIKHAGEAAVLAKMDELSQPFARSDGSIRFNNVFVWVSGIRD